MTVVPAVPDDYQYQLPTQATSQTSSQVQYLDQVGQAAVNQVPATAPGLNSGLGQISGLGQTAGYGSNTPVITTDALGNFTLMGLVETLIAYAFILAGALAAVFIFVGGISFILSGGNDEKIKQAINTIRYSIIGLIVTLLSFTFVIIVGRMFGLDFMQYLSFEKVRNDISRLIAPSNAVNPQQFEIQY